MPSLLTSLATATTTASTKTPASSSSSFELIIIVAIFAGVYLLFLRPRQQRARRTQTAARNLGVGDEVVSIGGIRGRVLALDSEEVEVEVAPGVALTFLRRAVNARPQPAGSPAPFEPSADERFGGTEFDDPYPEDPGDDDLGDGDLGDGEPGDEPDEPGQPETGGGAGPEGRT